MHRVPASKWIQLLHFSLKIETNFLERIFLRLTQSVPSLAQPVGGSRKNRSSLPNAEHLNLGVQPCLSSIKNIPTAANTIARSSTFKRRTTAALVKTRPATLNVDKRRQTMEQILTTGLVLLEVMVTCPREYSIVYGKEHQYHQTEAYERPLLMK